MSSNYINILEKGLEANPNDWKVRGALIEELINADDSDTIVTSIKNSPTLPKEKQILELVSKLSNHPSAIEALLTRSLEEIPNSAPLHVAFSKYKIAQSEYQSAKEHYQASKLFDDSFVDYDIEAALRVVSRDSETKLSSKDSEDEIASEEIVVRELSPEDKNTPAKETNNASRNSETDTQSENQSPELTAKEQETSVHSLPQLSERDDTKEKIAGFTLSFFVLLGIIALMSLIKILAPKAKPPEIVAISIGEQVNPEVITKQPVQQPRTQASAPSSPQMTQTISSSTVSPISLPTVEVDLPSDSIGLSSSLGAGLSFGSGIGSSAGGSVNFMGTSGKGNRFLFVVDFSRSMGNMNSSPRDFNELSKLVRKDKVSREILMRHRLIKALKELPQGSEYQIILFSKWAYAHDGVLDEWMDKEDFYEEKGDKHLARLKEVEANSTQDGSGYDIDDYEFPQIKYLVASSDRIAQSIKIIERTPTTYGTNWQHPLLMALSIKPKPDVIFFMTDGAVTNPEKALNLVEQANQSGVKINTTSMMEPKAIEALQQLAQENGGEFSIIEEDGTVKNLQ